MSGFSTFRPLITTAGFCALAAVAGAQSSAMHDFAISLHEQLGAPAEHQADLGFVSIRFDEQTAASLGAFLNADTQSPAGQTGFAAMNNGHIGQSRHTQQGLHSFDSFMPKEDGLTVVPLPPAAFAGFGLLAAFAGIRYARKNKN